MDKIAELEKLVQQLKRNREKVPLQDLKTKYRKAYDELRGRISDLATEILKDQLRDIRLEQSEVYLFEELETLVEGIPIEASEALKKYDMVEFRAVTEKLRAMVLQHIKQRRGEQNSD